MLTNDVNVVRYLVSGNTYSIPFPYWKTSDIKAYITLADETVQPLVYGTDYTVTTPDAVSGTLTKTSAWTDAEKLTIIREVELTQEIDLINGERIDGEELEKGLDLKAAGLQQMQEQFSRSVMTSVDEPGANIVIPNTEARKGTGDGTILGFDGTGGGVLLRDLKQFDQDVANTAANATAAANSATLANKWAENPEDTPVEPGSYSAKHWAAKAAGSASSASASATTATSEALDSEAYAIGKRGGQDVPASDPAYHNNTKYYYDLVVGAISGALRYQGTWDMTGQTDYSGIPTPRVKGDLFYCQGTAVTIDGRTYTQGDLIIFNQDVASTITTSAIDKIDNTETVTPDNACTLKNKTIAFSSNTMTDVAGTIATQTLKNKTIDSENNSLTVSPVLITQTVTPNLTKVRNFVVTTANAVVHLGNGAYSGYVVPVVANATCSVDYTGSGGSTETTKLKAGQKAYFVWQGSYWIREMVVGKVITDTCTWESSVVKVEGSYYKKDNVVMVSLFWTLKSSLAAGSDTGDVSGDAPSDILPPSYIYVAGYSGGAPFLFLFKDGGAIKLYNKYSNALPVGQTGSCTATYIVNN